MPIIVQILDYNFFASSVKLEKN